MPCPFLGADWKLKGGRQNDAFDPEVVLPKFAVPLTYLHQQRGR